MKLFSLLSLVVSPLFIAVNARQNIRDAPSTTLDIQDGQTGVLMVFPPAQTFTGTKHVPDADHPFIAPGPNDMRGPCPGMNTLANHGYISRNGITTFEEIILGAGEAFNIDPKMASGMAAMNILTRGNPFVNKVSIGGVSPLVPPLPGQIDGPVTQGIAKHGRVEGDASLTRSDVHIGDNRNFNQTLWDQDLEQLAALGDDGPDGPATVFNLQTLVAMARSNLETDQVLDPEFAIPFRRLNLVYGAPSLVLGQVFFLNTDSNATDTDFVPSVFANGTTQQSTKRIMTSFFMNQTFPENWHRAAVPVLGSPIPAEAMAALPEWVPGHNDENGVFVADPKPPAPFNISQSCGNYWDVLVNAVPASLANVTGIFKQNVDLLTGILFNASGCAEPIAPAGPTNV
ncbi:Cloroperoxidase [Mycena venus]|uniref:Cloroperoxidase n=1 Tax=Mycena venus TaxID=2733690 RepID=A0A8H6X3X3_9AGAR|nr:Cloroperoxidase [Mycena venus]